MFEYQFGICSSGGPERNRELSLKANDLENIIQNVNILDSLFWFVLFCCSFNMFCFDYYIVLYYLFCIVCFWSSLHSPYVFVMFMCGYVYFLLCQCVVMFMCNYSFVLLCYVFSTFMFCYVHVSLCVCFVVCMFRCWTIGCCIGVWISVWHMFFWWSGKK